MRAHRFEREAHQRVGRQVEPESRAAGPPRRVERQQDHQGQHVKPGFEARDRDARGPVQGEARATEERGFGHEDALAAAPERAAETPEDHGQRQGDGEAVAGRAAKSRARLGELDGRPAPEQAAEHRAPPDGHEAPRGRPGPAEEIGGELEEVGAEHPAHERREAHAPRELGGHHVAVVLKPPGGGEGHHDPHGHAGEVGKLGGAHGCSLRPSDTRPDGTPSPRRRGARCVASSSSR